MSASVLDDILNYTVGVVTGVGILDPKTQVQIPVAKRKLPRREETMDALTQITVWRSDQPEEIQYLAFNAYSYTYLVYVTIITPGNQDLTNNIDLYSSWREQIETAFRVPNISYPIQVGYMPLNGAPTAQVWEVRVRPDVFLPRQELNQQYDYFALGLLFKATDR